MLAAIAVSAGLVTLAGTQPQLASTGDQVYVAVGAANVISVARSDDAGVTFSAPVALPSAGVLSLGRHRGPRLGATPQAVVVAAVYGRKGGGADGDLVVYRSTDRGRTWARSAPINRVPGAAREGLHALAVDPSGLMVLAWLDLRDTGTRIYAAVSRDHGATWAADRLVYASPSGTVCECCHPSVAIGAGGRVHVMFRNSLDGHRDLYVTESRDGETFSAPVKQGSGSWTLAACPMDGGALTVDGGDVASVWRREGEVFLTRAGGAEVRLGAGKDPVALGSAARLDLAWTTPRGVAVRVAGAGSPAGAGAKAETIVGAGGYASLAATRAGAVVAWEQAGRSLVRVLPRGAEAAVLSARPAAPR